MLIHQYIFHSTIFLKKNGETK